MALRSNFKFEHDYIKMTKGDTLAFGVVIEGIDTLDSAYFSCKKDLNGEYLFQKSLCNGIEQNEEGYTIRVAPEDTKNAEVGKYFYDLQIGVNDDVYTILKGVLEIEYDVTN